MSSPAKNNEKEKAKAEKKEGETPDKKPEDKEEKQKGEKKNKLAGLKEALKMKKDDSDDSESDDTPSDEDDDDWLLSTPTDASATSTAPSATAITIRNKPEVSFIDVEEEKNIMKQIKTAKATKKKMKKSRKVMKKAVKISQQVGAGFDAYLSYLNTFSGENVCVDDSIDKNLKASLEAMHAFRDSGSFAEYTSKIEHNLTQVKSVENHATLLVATGKERRAARDKRIKAETASEKVDVADEAQYQKRMEIVNTHKDKDNIYREEFKSFKEHCSSQLAQAMRNNFLDSAKYLEDLAAALRKCADMDKTNYLVTEDFSKKYEKFENEASPVKERVQLFTSTGKDALNKIKDALKPEDQPVQGIPMVENPAEGTPATPSAATASPKASSRSINTRAVPGAASPKGEAASDAASPTAKPGETPRKSSNTKAPHPPSGSRPSPQNSSAKRGGGSNLPSTKDSTDYIKMMEMDYDIDWDLWGISKTKRQTSSSNSSANDNYFESFGYRNLEGSKPNGNSVLPRL